MASARNIKADDVAHMRAALALARRGIGNTWPNPSVGCVVVNGGRVVGRAVTAAGGRPHAEPAALEAAGDAARGGTAYVTLEPCCHWGRTPPCTDALVASGITRVVIATRDPDPRVDGAGIDKLRAAGLEVEEGVLRAEADELAAGFRLRVREGRPLVTLKLASTLDGRIATHDGESRWITGEAARKAAHALRGRNDAVMVGVGTVLADDPELTCRIPDYRPNPVVRVVADSHLRTPLTSRLVRTAVDSPTWMLIRPGADPERRRGFVDTGVKLIEVAGGSVGVATDKALHALGEAGITRLLVEGGAQLAAGLLRAGLVDRIAWFHAPSILGADGWPAVQGFGIGRLDDMPRYIRIGETPFGHDMLTEFARSE
jgi:diaminohydroxyphosphoribosylaminopyrimidine deaminase / 5-amino-6-(5-phosphoribosylamino)uracil reductase